METREQLMRQIQSVGFAVNDLNLFLDSHPDDKDALAYFKELNRQYAALVADYTQHFGPLTVADTENSDYFDWIATPWPWEN